MRQIPEEMFQTEEFVKTTFMKRYNKFQELFPPVLEKHGFLHHSGGMYCRMVGDGIFQAVVCDLAQKKPQISKNWEYGFSGTIYVDIRSIYGPLGLWHEAFRAQMCYLQSYFLAEEAAPYDEDFSFIWSIRGDFSYALECELEMLQELTLPKLDRLNNAKALCEYLKTRVAAEWSIRAPGLDWNAKYHAVIAEDWELAERLAERARRATILMERYLGLSRAEIRARFYKDEEWEGTPKEYWRVHAASAIPDTLKWLPATQRNLDFYNAVCARDMEYLKKHMLENKAVLAAMLEERMPGFLDGVNLPF